MLAWFSPLSLAEIMNPFGSIDAGAVAVLALTCCAVVFAVVRIETRRQMGSSLIPQHPGRAHGRPSLRDPFRLALRLQRGILIGMLPAGIGVGAFAATLALLGSEAARTDPAVAATIRTTVGEDGPIYDLLLGYVMLFVAEFAAVAGALAALRSRREEAMGNLEVVRGTPVGPRRWVLAQVAVALVSAIAVVGAAWVGAAAVYAATGVGGGVLFGPLLGSVFAQLPAALVYVAVAFALFALVPRWASGITWGIILVGEFFAEFGGWAGLPDWLIATTPYAHTPLVTTPEADMSALWWMTGIAMLVAAMACRAYEKRDLAP